MIDIGLTHIALPVSKLDRSIEFYATYAGMQVIHRRMDAETGVAVALTNRRGWNVAPPHSPHYTNHD